MSVVTNLHSPEESAEHNTRLGTNLDPGEFTPWEPLPANTDLLFTKVCTVV